MNANRVYADTYSELLVLSTTQLIDTAINEYNLGCGEVVNMTNQELIERCAIIETANYVH